MCALNLLNSINLTIDNGEHYLSPVLQEKAYCQELFSLPLLR